MTAAEHQSDFELTKDTPYLTIKVQAMVCLLWESLTLNVRGERVISVYLGQYHGCWYPGSLGRQDISSHDIDYMKYLGPSLAWGRILSTCFISMWRNDTKCKYMFMFLLKNLARKGLIKIDCVIMTPHCIWLGQAYVYSNLSIASLTWNKQEKHIEEYLKT